MTTQPDPDTSRTTRRRIGLIGTVLLLVAVDLGLKTWAEHTLSNGQTIDLAVIQLKLAYNPGVAFSLGTSLPEWAIITVTGLITIAIAIATWRVSRTKNTGYLIGLALILAGATANLIDRIQDGVVTDFLHISWFPTFNTADSYITIGAVTLIAATLLNQPEQQH